MLTKVLCWKMVSKIVGMVAISRKENVPGVAQMVGAVEKIGLEMDAMVILVGQIIINAYLKQVCNFTLRFLLCVLFQFLVGRTVHFHYCITLPIIQGVS